MLTKTVYGFADEADVAKAIEARLEATNPDKKAALAKLLGEAVDTLLKINGSIAVNSRHRYLIAAALEEFANGGK